MTLRYFHPFATDLKTADLKPEFLHDDNVLRTNKNSNFLSVFLFFAGIGRGTYMSLQYYATGEIRPCSSEKQNTMLPRNKYILHKSAFFLANSVSFKVVRYDKEKCSPNIGQSSWASAGGSRTSILLEIRKLEPKA